ncbi:S1 family peptidase [Desulfobacter latus]|uniref:Trypsin-like peptidase domain-containing protein n=1 Tax=Desulfobacter latus TaxID=2292 RepID=A0A850T6J9_9BACT|nr:serine protease [Desulfobacter latus]NWH04992.1 trypsin-like peptidase domain-containing protein [Desulfobacter latus]
MLKRWGTFLIGFFLIVSCSPAGVREKIKRFGITQALAETLPATEKEAKACTQPIVLKQCPPLKTTYFIFAKKYDGDTLRIERGVGTVVWATKKDQWIMLTCNHIVHEATSINVSLWSGKKQENPMLPAKVMASDPRADLALLSFTSSKQPGIAKLDFSECLLGEDITAIGQPARGYGAMTKGIISGFWPVEKMGHLIVSDVLITTGFSGSGAFLNGKMIGIITGKTADARRGFAYILPIARAIPLLYKGLGCYGPHITGP